MYKLFISLRLLRSHKIVYFSIAGVAVGIMILIVVTSVMGGFSRDLKARIRGMQSHIIVTPIDMNADLFIVDYPKLIDRLKKIDGVKGCAPRIEWMAMIGARGSIYGKGRTIQFMGIDPAAERETSEIEDYFRKGGMPSFDFQSGGSEEEKKLPGIVCGSELFRIASDLTLVTVRPRGGSFSYFQRQFKVLGAFRSGMAEYDSSLILMHLRDAQKFLNLSERVVTDIAVTCIV